MGAGIDRAGHPAAGAGAAGAAFIRPSVRSFASLLVEQNQCEESRVCQTLYSRGAG